MRVTTYVNSCKCLIYDIYMYIYIYDIYIIYIHMLNMEHGGVFYMPYLQPSSQLRNYLAIERWPWRVYNVFAFLNEIIYAQIHTWRSFLYAILATIKPTAELSCDRTVTLTSIQRVCFFKWNNLCTNTNVGMKSNAAWVELPPLPVIQRGRHFALHYYLQLLVISGTYCAHN